ncbi:uncharacterized protein LOC144821811 isoform X2 [Lissotriton helveticus]
MSLKKAMLVQLHLLTFVAGVSSENNSTNSSDSVYISLSLTCIIMAVCIGGTFTAAKRIKKRHAGYRDNHSRQNLKANGKDLKQTLS